jgi:hypothetical protein
MLKPAALILALAVAGCGSEAPELDLDATLQVSQMLGADIEQVSDGAESWHGAVQAVNLKLVVTDSPTGWSIVSGSCTGFGNTTGKRITIDTERIRRLSRVAKADYRVVLRSTVIHELGHAMGLDHVPGGVMEDKTPASKMIDYVDQGTIDQFCRLHSAACAQTPAESLDSQ